jgi:DNA-binding transcriptional ArsR family regulator
MRGWPDSDAGDAAFELAHLAKALGHPARVQILQLLGARDRCYCGDLVDELPLAQATVSQHLKVLRDAGLIQGEIEGPRVCYCARPEGVVRLAGLLDALVARVSHTDPDCCDVR